MSYGRRVSSRRCGRLANRRSVVRPHVRVAPVVVVVADVQNGGSSDSYPAGFWPENIGVTYANF